MLKDLAKTLPGNVALKHMEIDIPSPILRAQANRNYNYADEIVLANTSIVIADRFDPLYFSNRPNLRAVVVVNPGDPGDFRPPKDVPLFFLGQTSSRVWDSDVAIDFRPCPGVVDTDWSRMVAFCSLLLDSDAGPVWGIVEVIVSGSDPADEFVYALALQPTRKRGRVVLRCTGDKTKPGHPGSFFLPQKLDSSFNRWHVIGNIMIRGSKTFKYLDPVHGYFGSDAVPFGYNIPEWITGYTEISFGPAKDLKPSKTDRIAPTATVMALARHRVLVDGVSIAKTDMVVDCDTGRLIEDYAPPKIDQKVLRLKDEITEADRRIAEEPTTASKSLWMNRYYAALSWSQIITGKSSREIDAKLLSDIESAEKDVDIELPQLMPEEKDDQVRIVLPQHDEIPGNHISLPPPIKLVTSKGKSMWIFPVACLGRYTADVDFAYTTISEKEHEDGDLSAPPGDEGYLGMFLDTAKLALGIETKKQREEREKREAEEKREKEEAEEKEKKEKEAKEAEEAKKKKEEEEKEAEKAKKEKKETTDALVKKYETLKVKTEKKIDIVEENLSLYAEDRLFSLRNRYVALFAVFNQDSPSISDPLWINRIIRAYLELRTKYAAFSIVSTQQARDIFMRLYETWDAAPLGNKRLDGSETEWTRIKLDKKPGMDILLDPWVGRCLIERMKVETYMTKYKDNLGFFEFRPTIIEPVSDLAGSPVEIIFFDSDLPRYSTLPLIVLERLVKRDWDDYTEVKKQVEAHRDVLESLAWNFPMAEGIRAGFVNSIIFIQLPSMIDAERYAALVGKRATRAKKNVNIIVTPGKIADRIRMSVSVLNVNIPIQVCYR